MVERINYLKNMLIIILLISSLTFFILNFLSSVDSNLIEQTHNLIKKGE